MTRDAATWIFGAILSAAVFMEGGQAPSTPNPLAFHFEVASIKPHAPVPSDATNRGGGGTCHGTDSFYAANLRNAPPPLGRCVFTRITLKGLIENAYKPPKGPIFGFGRMQDISGGPAWLDADTWDVQAKAEDDKATEAQLREMLQTLLADRFQLRFHHETREEQGYVLVVAKGGLKIKPEPGDDWKMTLTAAKASFVKYTMPMFASFVAQFVAAPVDDRTGLEASHSTLAHPQG